MGVICGCKFFLPELLKAECAHIVNLSSMFGIFAMPGQAIYSTSKAGVRAFTEALWTELDGTPVLLTSVMGTTVIDSWAGVGDMPNGAVQTQGMFMVDGTADDWFLSDYIVAWIANPANTRIPDVHFIHEARYRGAKLVVVSPDLSATAIHADLWINPKQETDAAFALAAASAIIEEGLFDEEAVREQTDLPFLVREDNGHYLRESDVRRDGKNNRFYLWDQVTAAMVPAPGCEGESGHRLALDGISPAPADRMQPGMVQIFHAWEPYQFENWDGQQAPVVSPCKPTHLAGGYGQLHYRMFYNAPSHNPRGVGVEVEKAST
jgi:nitrate reductase alpha subunit